MSPFTSEPKLTNPKGEVHPTLYLGLSSDHVTGLVAENRMLLNLNWFFVPEKHVNHYKIFSISFYRTFWLVVFWKRLGGDTN